MTGIWLKVIFTFRKKAERSQSLSYDFSLCYSNCLQIWTAYTCRSGNLASYFYHQTQIFSCNGMTIRHAEVHGSAVAPVSAFRSVTGCSRAVTPWLFYGLTWKVYYFVCLWLLLIMNPPGLVLGCCEPPSLSPTHWGCSQMGNKLGRRFHGLVSKALFQLG